MTRAGLSEEDPALCVSLVPSEAKFTLQDPSESVNFQNVANASTTVYQARPTNFLSDLVFQLKQVMLCITTSCLK